MATWPAWIGELGGAGARSAPSWPAASGGRARGDERGRGAMEVRGRFEPAHALAVAAAASRCACDAPPRAPPHSLTQLTASCLASLAAPVHPGRCSTRSAMVPKDTELIYYHHRVRPEASRPSSTSSGGSALLLPNTVAERVARPTGERLWVGRKGWGGGEPVRTRPPGCTGGVGGRARRTDDAGGSARARTTRGNERTSV